MILHMNKISIVFFLICFSLSVSAQQLSQYNTGTLYDSFENPSQRSFIPDSSRQYAFNFFIPNFDANIFIKGNIQQSVQRRLLSKSPSYSSDLLTVGLGKVNHINANVNAYAIMFKTYTSLNGDVEMGFSYQTRLEARGLVTDETFALLSGDNAKYFPNVSYDNIFNNNFQLQSYNQVGYSYRERINKQFAFGFKLNALLGIKYSKFDIRGSNINIEPPQDKANLALQGRYYSSYIPGQASSRDYLPTFRNPGAGISLGTSIVTQDKITIQANIKDLGFIRWSSRSIISDFNSSDSLRNISGIHREDTIYNRTIKILRSGAKVGAFVTKTNAKAELSASKTYWIDYDSNIKYSPTLIGSKELFYSGFTAALVNHLQYQDYTGTISFSYDDLKMFNIGAQFLYKNPNVEYFIGSERLLNTGRLTLAALGLQSQIDHYGSYSGADIYLGFSLKFGAIIDHPMNASYIPMGEKGFFGRLFGRLFKTNR